MSIIQKLQNKYSAIVVTVLVISLIGFLVMDGIQSNVSNLFSRDNTLMASINGERIDAKSFQGKLKTYEDNVKARSKKTTLTAEETTQIREQLYNDLVNEKLLNAEIEKLGLDVSDKEFQDMLTGEFVDPQVRQSFSDPKTGIFDPNKVREYMAALGTNPDQKEEWRNFEDALVKQKRITKYIDLVKNGIYTPKFMVEDAATQRRSTASISYVMIPYTSAASANLKVTDDEIVAYMNKYPAQFKAEENQVNMEYVSFPIIPSSADTALSLGKLIQVKDAFALATNNEEMVTNNSDNLYDETFFNINTLTSDNKEELLSAGVGTVVGPYYDQTSFKISKVLAKKSIPDSVSVSHILIAITEQNNEANAKKSIDSIETMIKSGADFAQIAASRSADQQSAQKGGDLGFFTKESNPIPETEFTEFAFESTQGQTKVIKTRYGYHLVKVTGQKAFQNSVQLATIEKELEAGQSTTTAAFSAANKFFNVAKDANSFSDNAKKIGKDKRLANDVSEIQENIPGIGSARDLVRWAFEAKQGAITNPMPIENNYIVARLISKSEKGGLLNVASARSIVEPILMKRKQGKSIVESIKSASSLQAIATAKNVQVMQNDSISMMNFSQSLGFEPAVIGASFNPALKGKMSPAIMGEQGVFYMMVLNTKEDTTLPRNIAMERMQMESQFKSAIDQYIPVILKKKADIVDNRALFQ